MNPADYSQTECLRLLLQGPPGSGKSIVASQFPAACIIDLDRNWGGVRRFLQQQGKPLPHSIEFVDRDDKGNLIPMPNRYDKLAQILVACAANPDIKSVVIDSGTVLADVMIAKTLASQGKTAVSDFKDGRQFWGFFATNGKSFMAQLSQLNKHVVLVVHEKVKENEQGQRVYPIEVAWPGQVGDILGCFFTDVWRCEADILPVPAGAPPQYKWYLRTMPDHRYQLKNTHVPQVPPLFEFKWEKIEEALK